MPSQSYYKDGLRITVRDKRWWRRFVPFYTDFFKTSFWVRFERLEVNPKGEGAIKLNPSYYDFNALFSDGTYEIEILSVHETDVAEVEVGDHKDIETEQFLVSPPGQTSITWGDPPDDKKLFSYFVVSESSVMASIFALILSVFVLGGTIGGAVLGAWLQPDPVVIQLPPPALATAVDDAMLTPTPSLGVTQEADEPQSN